MIQVIIILLILLSGSVCHVFAGEDITSQNKALETPNDSRNLTFQYKNIGDQYTTQDNYKAAAPYYMKALSLGRDDLSLGERLQIAIYLSWAGKMQESLTELDLILNKDPSNLKARIHHARVLSWSGSLDKAIKEADEVLKDSPENKDALLVKANALRWNGISWKALPIYNQILEKEEDFDTRLGTTYAQLSAGDIKGAKESRRLLKPTYPYQEKELGELTLHMDRIVRPSLALGYSYYNDSDENITNRYSAGFGFWAGKWRNDLTYRHTDAEDDFRDNYADDISFRTYSKVTRVFGIGGGLGLTNMTNGESDTFMTWQIKADVFFLNGNAGIAVSRDTATDIAELIENKIRYTSTNVSINQKLTDRWGIAGAYRYRDYSDDNSSHQIQLSSTYAVYSRNPNIQLGGRLIYLDFARQTRSGYFDPDNFISPQVFTTISFEREKLYGYLEPFLGYQTFHRYGDSSNDITGGGYGLLGIRLSKHFSLEMNAEGGNYDNNTAAGWNYYLVGSRLLIFL
jgi:tetratricopeptide (TPR) repeat protein